jgi:hypothetical protein
VTLQQQSPNGVSEILIGAQWTKVGVICFWQPTNRTNPTESTRRPKEQRISEKRITTTTKTLARHLLFDIFGCQPDHQPDITSGLVGKNSTSRYLQTLSKEFQVFIL